MDENEFLAALKVYKILQSNSDLDEGARLYCVGLLEGVLGKYIKDPEAEPIPESIGKRVRKVLKGFN